MSINARVINEELTREDRGPGSSWLWTEYEVAVTGATTKEAAEAEARWRVRQEADGEVQRVEHVRTEGPMTLDGQYIVTYTVETLRYW